MAYRWSLIPARAEPSNLLARQLGVHPVVGHLLVNRGIETLEAGRMFLERRLRSLHDPEGLPGVAGAVDRLAAAVARQQKICIYGDYDVDGMCATAILYECLSLAGARPRYFIPDRLEEGYGVNGEALKRLREDGVEVIVTVDCGITSLLEAEVARGLGLTYIVTDHHEFGESFALADAVVHPRLPGSRYPFGQLCGAGVAFKLAWELARRISGQRKVDERFERFLLRATALAAIGTICDVVPLIDENRILVHHGLLALQKDPPIGLSCLMEEAKVRFDEPLGSETIGFQLGPRLNACGRLGQARLGVELLVTRDPRKAADLARHFEQSNDQRKRTERDIFKAARQQFDETYGDNPPTGVVLASEAWHAGVIGIVASRLVERIHRPTILVGFQNGVGTGSGRSIPGFHLQQALGECADLLLTHGGHAMAAGLRIERSRFEAFRERFHECSARRLAECESTAELRIDLEVDLGVLQPNLVKALEALEPFGNGNPEPNFLVQDVEVVGDPRGVGGGERHLSFTVKQGNVQKRAIAFGHGERLEELVSQERRCCLVFRPFVNRFRGYESVELQVRDFCAGSRATFEMATACLTS